MDATTEFRPQPGLRRVLEAFKSTESVFDSRQSPSHIQQRGIDHRRNVPLSQPERAERLQRLARIATEQDRENPRPAAASVLALQDATRGVTPVATWRTGRSHCDQCKLNKGEAVRPPSTCAERGLGNVVYLEDVRKRFDHNDEPSGPSPGAAAARSYEFTFLRAVAAP
jgi:hypothetical protein